MASRANRPALDPAMMVRVILPRLFFAIAAAIAIALGALAQAEAGIVVTVDKSAQRLTVSVDGVKRYNWPVSTARIGYRTPVGTYRPERLERQCFSSKYNWSPMPHSIFFDGGYAIHGSYEVSRLGSPASHGCIRLRPDNAALLYSLVQRRVGDTRIVVTGDSYEPDVSERHSNRFSERVSERVSERYSDRYSERYAERYEPRRSRRNFEEVFESDEPRRGRWERRY
jgi:L,D-transpeptidase catalytic domain